MLRHIKCTIIILLLLSALPATAATWYVNCSSGAAKNQVGYGTSEVYPWKNITYAATMSAVSDTIRVYPGTYNSGTGESFPTTGISMTGRYFLSTSTYLATIDAGAGSRAITMNTSATIEGFTVKISGGADADGALYFAGKGFATSNYIYCSGSTARGIYLNGSADNSNISGNRISLTGSGDDGVYLYSAADNITVQSNTVEASTTGMGIYLYSNNTGYNLTQNTLKGTGSDYGIYCRSGVSIRSGTISSNEVMGFANGIYLRMQANYTAEAYNNTVVKYTAYGISNNDYAGTINAKNNIVCAEPRLGKYVATTTGIIKNLGTINSGCNDCWNNETDYKSVTGGTGDITQSPRFIDAGSDDYRIGTDSPCATGGKDGTYMGRYAPAGTSSLTPESWVDAAALNDDGPGDIDHPYQTITKALGVTTGTIHAKAGTYTENSGITLSEDQYLKSEVTPTTYATIESGSNTVNTVTLGPNTTLEGFTISTANSSTSYFAVYVPGANASILNNIVASNVRGVGLYGASALVSGNNILCSGTAYGIYLDTAGDNSTIKNNDLKMSSSGSNCIYLGASADNITIQSNTLEASGNGMYFYQSNTGYNITQNTLRGDGTGAGIDVSDSYTIRNGTISSNEVINFANGFTLCVANTYTANVYNNTIVKFTDTGISNTLQSGTINANNNIVCAEPRLGKYTAVTTGIIKSTGTVNSSYNDCWNNETDYNAVTGAIGDITQYPRFISPESDDYRIGTDSPCNLGGGAYLGWYAPIGTSSSINTNSWVDASAGSDNNTGTTESLAWKTLNKAISNTANNIYAKAGTYDAANGETFPLPFLTEDQYLRSLASPTALAVIETTNARAVRLGRAATLEGFKIHSSSGSSTDGAVYSDGQSYILNNDITCEAADCNGIFLSGTADGSEVRSNTIWVGGTSGKGIKADTACNNLTISGNTVTAGYYGILLYHQNSGYSITGNKLTAATQSSGFGVKGGDYDVTANNIYSGSITSNEVRGFRAGMYLKANSSYVINVTNNTLVRNGSATSPQGGIYLTYATANGATYNLSNNIIAAEVGGYTQTGSAGITRYTSTYPTVNSKYNDVYANDTNWGNSIVSGEGEKSSDALFVDATNNDYHLMTGSPCINAATPEGEMGCYDYTGSCSITLRSPVGGENWNGYIYHDITWESTGYCGAISLYYSLNGGADYTLIAAGEVNDGEYPWYVPFIATTEAKVKVIANGVEVVSSESAGTFTITTPPPPSVTSIYPTSTQNNQTNLALTITGEAFQIGVAVKLSKSGESDINASSVNVVNTSQLDCTFNIQDKKAGTWLLTVTNPDTQNVIYEGLTINNAPPAPISIDPGSGSSEGGTQVTISGSQFLRPDYKRSISISNEGSALSDYQVLVTLNTATLIALGKMRSDCGDVRFYDSDQTTPLSFWLESGANTSATRFWVKISTLEAASSKTMYITYGTPTLTSASNLGATMLRTISNLQGSWALDETSGGNVADGSGNGLNGTANGTAIVDGKFGKARSFNGSSDYVGVAYNALLAPTSQLAFDCWAYNSNWASYASSASIISKTQIGGYNIEMNGSGNEGVGNIGVLVYRHSAYGIGKTALSGLSAGWHHFMGVYDGRYTRFFMDGTLKQTNDAGSNYAITYANNNSLIMGADAGTAAVPEGNYFTGYIDETHVFNNALTTAEVQDLAGNYGFTNASYANQLIIRKRAAVEPVSTIGTVESGNLTKVLFGDTYSPSVLYVNYTTLTATTPAHSAGTVTVTVVNPDDQVGTLESAFTYIAPLGVTLDTPNGGETWQAGTWQNITWESTGSPTSFRLYYTTSEVVGYQSISNEASGTSYAWLVPNFPTSEAKVRIEALDNTNIMTDESNAVFTITAAAAGPSLDSITLKDRKSGGAEYTNERIVSVEANGVDGDPTEMIRSEISTFEGASWIIYTNPATFELSAGDGAKTVYYKLRNVSLVESAVKNSGIMMDTTPPTSPEVFTAVGTPETNMTAIYLTWEAGTDTTSGVAGYNLYHSNSPDTGYDKFLSRLTVLSTTDATVSLGTDYYYYIKTEDRASNESLASIKASVPLLTITRESQITAPAGYSGGASDAVPGATIKYTLYITSSGFSAAQNVVVTDKVPPYTQFKIDSATGEAIISVQYSNDNGESYTYSPSGTFVDPAVTNIRWNSANISSGATKQAEYSVVIR